MTTNKLYSSIFFLTLAILLPGAAFAASTPTADTPYMPSTPKQVLKEISAAPDVVAVISGGWGYKKDSAMIVANPYKGTKTYFNLRPFEEELMDVRNREEFYIVPPDGERYFPVGFNILSYKAGAASGKGGKKFDFATGEVVLLPEKYWKEMDNELKGQKNNAVVTVFKDKVTKMKREYWFEVSEPLRHNQSLKENK